MRQRIMVKDAINIHEESDHYLWGWWRVDKEDIKRFPTSSQNWDSDLVGEERSADADCCWETSLVMNQGWPRGAGCWWWINLLSRVVVWSWVMGIAHRVKKFSRCCCRYRFNCFGTGSQEECPRWLRNSLEDRLDLIHGWVVFWIGHVG